MDWFHLPGSISAAELRALPQQRYLLPLIRVMYENVIRAAAAERPMYVASIYRFGHATDGAIADAFREFLGVFHTDGGSGRRLLYRELTAEEEARLPEFLELLKTELGRKLPGCTLIPVYTETKSRLENVMIRSATLTVTWQESK